MQKDDASGRLRREIAQVVVVTETVLVLDFGSQYTQLIARRIREQRVYSVVHPFDFPVEKIRELSRQIA